MKKKIILISIFALIIFSIFMFTQEKKDSLILATTTSTYDTGLLDYIVPSFESEFGVQVKIISVGTGQAIKNGERGDVDLILVHAPDAEKEFVLSGYGINRECVMYNDFIILGPANDPANIKGKSVTEAFKIISETNSKFISRGDNSGTHKKELKIWTLSGVSKKGEGYLEVGDGMGNTIRIADQKLAYTLADRGTYLSFKDQIDLIPLVEGDDILLNQYGIVAVNPRIHPKINFNGAMNFIFWILTEETQSKIESFQKNNQQLFYPLRGECVGD